MKKKLLTLLFCLLIAMLPTTVLAAAPTIQNVSYAVEYTANGSPVAAPAAENFQSASPAPMTFGWKAADGTALASPPAAAGTYTLTVSQAAAEGWDAGSADFSVTVTDNTEPVFGEVTAPGVLNFSGTLYANGPATFSVPVSDRDSGIASVTASYYGGGISATPLEVTLANGVASATVPVLQTAPGMSLALDFTAADGAGNQKIIRAANLFFDAAPPTIVPGSSVTGEVAWTASAVSSSIVVGDDVSLASVTLSTDGGDPVEIAGDRITAGSRNAVVTIPETFSLTGEHRYVVTATDVFGKTATQNLMTRIDQTAPTVEVTGVTGGAWHGDTLIGQGSMTLALRVADAESGLDHVMCIYNGGPMSGTTVDCPVENGVASVTIPASAGNSGYSVQLLLTASDKVGNRTGSYDHLVPFRFDAAAPEVRMFGERPDVWLGALPQFWASDDAALASVRIAMDGGEPVTVFQAGETEINTNFSYTPDSLSDGPHTAVVTAVDLFGGTAERTISFGVDQEAPVFGTASYANGVKLNGTLFAGGDVTVSIPISDAGTGLKSVTAKLSQSTDLQITGTDGVYTVIVPFTAVQNGATPSLDIIATDYFNRTTEYHEDVLFDSAAPAVTLNVQPEAEGWRTEQPGLSVTVSQPYAYLSSVMIQADTGKVYPFFFEEYLTGTNLHLNLDLEGARTYTVTATNCLGVKTVKTFSVKVDTAPLAVESFTYATSYTTAEISFRSSDPVSGLTSAKLIGADGSVLAEAVGNAFYLTGLVPGSTVSCMIELRSGAGVSAVSIPILLTTSTLPAGAMYPPDAAGKLGWAAIRGVDAYNLYRASAENGPYTYLASVRGTEYSDAGAAGSGTTWYYRVRPYVRAAGRIWYGPESDSVSVYYPLAAPSVQAWSVDGSTMRLRWTAVEGAEGYEIYRLNADGSRTLLQTTSELRWIDPACVPGEVARYAVAAYRGNGETRSAGSEGFAAAAALAAPTLRSVRSNDGLLLRWDAVEGTDRFNVYRAESENGPFVYVASVVGTAWRDRTAESGKTYFYKLRPYLRRDGKIWYGQPSGVLSGSTMAAPVVKAAPLSGAVQLSWTAVPGARGYDVFRVNETGGYTYLTTTADLRYLDAGRADGTVSHYLVCAYRRDETGRQNGYYGAAAAVALGRPALRLAPSGGSALAWDAVPGATAYNVYRAEAGTGRYAYVASVAGTAFLDETAPAGAGFDYIVRAYRRAEGRVWYGGASAAVSVVIPDVT